MTYKELKQKLLTCEKTLKCLQNGTYKNLSPEDIKTTQNKLNVIKEGILKEMKSIKDAVEFEDEKEAAAFADKNPETPVKIVKESFSIEETKAIAKKVGKAVAMALKSVGDAVTSMKAIRVEENSFEIKVLYKNGSSDEFSFYISKEKLHLVDFTFDKELIDVGVKPSGEPIVHVDVLSNALVNHFRELDVKETKGAPKGHYFTKSGNLVKGRLTKDARERGARLSDPKDKQRSKVPPVTQYNNEAELKEINYSIYTEPEHFDICPGAEALRNELIDGGKTPEELGEWTFKHDQLFKLEKAVLKANKADETHVKAAVRLRDELIHLSRDLGIEAGKIHYLKGHVDKIKDVAAGKSVDEAELPGPTLNKFNAEVHNAPSMAKAILSFIDQVDDKESPNLRKSSKLMMAIKHLQDLAGDKQVEEMHKPAKLKKVTVGGKTFKLGEKDPRDNKDGVVHRISKFRKGYLIGTTTGTGSGSIFAIDKDGYPVDLEFLRENNEGEGDDHHYIKVPRMEYKAAMTVLDKLAEESRVKMDIVDSDGMGNVIIYFMFKDGDIASGEANSFMNDAVMDLQAYGINIYDHSAEMDEAELTKDEKKKLKDMSKSLKKSSKGHAGQAKYIDKLVKEGRGDMDMITRIIDDRADESGFESREEAAEVIAAIADHYKLNLKMIQNYLDSDGPVNPFADPNAPKMNEADLVAITDGQYAYIKGIIDILKTGEMPQDIGYRKEAIKALISLLRSPGDVKELWHGDHDDDGKLQEGTDLYDKKGLHFRRFAGPNGVAMQITTRKLKGGGFDYIQIDGKRLGEFASALMQAIRVFDDMSRQTPVDEAMGDDVPASMKGSVSKLQQVHSMIVNKMKSFAKMYKEKGGDHIFKSASGEENRVIDILKDLNNKKKKVEDALDKKVSGINKNQQLAETPEQEDAVRELRDIVDQVEELGDSARQIVRQNFPNEMSRMEGYGVFNLAYSNNRYDTTLGSEVDRLEGGDYDDLDDDNYPMEGDGMSTKIKPSEGDPTNMAYTDKAVKK